MALYKSNIISTFIKKLFGIMYIIVYQKLKWIKMNCYQKYEFCDLK